MNLWDELEGNELGILAELDRSSTDETLQQTESEYGMSFATREYASLSQLADALREGEVACILLNQAFLPLYAGNPWVRGISGGTEGNLRPRGGASHYRQQLAEQPEAERPQRKSLLQNPWLQC